MKFHGQSDIPVKCLILASFLEPVSAKISEACMPCRSSTVWVSKMFFAPVVWAASCAWESWRTAEVEESDFRKSLGEREHSWRRSIVDAIDGEEARVWSEEEVGRFGSESLPASNQHSAVVPPTSPPTFLSA